MSFFYSESFFTYGRNHFVILSCFYLPLFFHHKAFFSHFFWSQLLNILCSFSVPKFWLYHFFLPKTFFLSIFLFKYNQFSRGLSDHICPIKSSVKCLLLWTSCTFITVFLSFFFNHSFGPKWILPCIFHNCMFLYLIFNHG